MNTTPVTIPRPDSRVLVTPRPQGEPWTAVVRSYLPTGHLQVVSEYGLEHRGAAATVQTVDPEQVRVIVSDDQITVTLTREQAASLVISAAEDRDSEQEAADELEPCDENAADHMWREANVRRSQEAINVLTMAGVSSDDIAALRG